MKKLVCFIILVMILVTSISFAETATERDGMIDRQRAAQEYLEVAQTEHLFLQTCRTGISESFLSPEEKEDFLEFVQTIDISLIEEAMVDAMVDTFTTKEINAMTQFYGSKVGQKVLRKFPRYMAAVQPAMIEMIMRAAQKWEAQAAAD